MRRQIGGRMPFSVTLNWKISVFFCFMSPYLAPGGLTPRFSRAAR
jgi:hypothetical protein